MENLMVKNEARPGMMAANKRANLAIRNDLQPLDQVFYERPPVYDEERAGKFADEMIAAIKDDRMLTKRSVSADIALVRRGAYPASVAAYSLHLPDPRSIFLESPRSTFSLESSSVGTNAAPPLSNFPI